MARTHPFRYKHIISPALVLAVQAAWIAACVAVCLVVCTIHNRRSSRRKLRSCSASTSHRSRESNNGTPAAPAKVSPTLSDAKTDEHSAMQEEVGSPITVIDVGTHGPISPVFAPDQAPRRSLSLKYMKFTDRVSRMRSSRKEKTAEDTLWTKTIILGERCRVPSGDDDDDVVSFYDDRGNQRKNYRPRRPRSVPVSRTNSFADLAGIDTC